PNVEEMNLSHNLFQDFPTDALCPLPPPPPLASISNSVTTLRVLDLSYNQMTSLPSDISALVSLVQANLDGNLLTELPPDIGRLTHLQVLLVRNNKIASVCPEVLRASA